MAKPKTSLLSFGATGTIGNALTYQKRGTGTIVREKPVPRQPNTLPQWYQRWLYQDYAHLWAQQSVATKQQYASDGSRHHLTGFQYWMKYNLRNLPDLMAYWKLDRSTGPTTPDSSRNQNTATIFGASPATGLIDGCLSLDGINDYLDCGNNPSLHPTNHLTIECFVLQRAVSASVTEILRKGPLETYALSFDTPASNNLRFRVRDTTPANHFTPTFPITPGIFHHVAGVYDGTNGYLFVDGDLKSTTPWGPFTFAPSTNLIIGRDDPLAGRYFNGLIDHVKLCDQALTPAEILRHSLRRYPP